MHTGDGAWHTYDRVYLVHHVGFVPDKLLKKQSKHWTTAYINNYIPPCLRYLPTQHLVQEKNLVRRNFFRILHG
jgi:hypothetical protein